MKILWSLIVLSLVMQVANAQDTATQTIQRTRVYNTEVFVTGKKNPVTGTLAFVSDSLLYISSGYVPLAAAPSNNKGIRKLNYERITKVNIKRNGSVRRSLLHGALIGMGVGVITGFAMGDDPPCHQERNDVFGIGYGLCESFRLNASAKGLGLGLAGIFGGGLVGAVVGALAHKTFIIGGNKEKFHTMKAKLLP